MMKKKFFQVFAAALTLISAGCSNDDLSGNLSGENESGKDAVYMNVTVKLPVGAGGRSSTKPEGGSTSGTEVGLDHENTVNSVMLVLAKTFNYRGGRNKGDRRSVHFKICPWCILWNGGQT